MNKKVLLYSGGMDSWLIDKLWKPDVKLFVRIHTRGNDLEYQNLRNQIERHKIDDGNLEILDYDMSKFELPEMNYYMPLRNLHLVLLAAHYGNIICIGSVGGSVHLDNNDVFANMSENVINYLLSEKDLPRVKIELPYMNVSKTQLLREYIKQGGDINTAYTQTTSCYTPHDGKECLQCSSCASKFTAFYNNGYQYTDEEIAKFVSFVNNNRSVNEHDTIVLCDKLLNIQKCEKI